MKEVIRKYTNGEVTIVWKNKLCIHSGNCFKGLPAVFDPRRQPWIVPEGATTEEIINQVKKCPSGALSYVLNEAAEKQAIGISCIHQFLLLRQITTNKFLILLPITIGIIFNS